MNPRGAIMPAFPDCPPLDCWPALLGDTLAATERESYERHLESCPACQEHLRRLDENEDDLRRLGRCIGDPSAAATDPTLIQVLGRLHESKAPPRTGPLEPTDLYFLRPAEQSGVLGLLGDYEVLEVIGQGSMGVVLKAFEPRAAHGGDQSHGPGPGRQRHGSPPLHARSASRRRCLSRSRRRRPRRLRGRWLALSGHAVRRRRILQDHLDRTGPLEVADIVRIGLQTASGLAAAHAQGLIHRDIKPANLLLENGVARVKITDFGLGRMADDVGLTQNGVVAGTPEYMAPEQARGEAVDHRADLFSLGSVLYACCAGSPPFRGSTALAVLRQVSEEKPVPLRSLRADVPAWLEAFIARLMAKDPAERFQSAAEIAQLLEGYLAHLRQPTTVLAPETPSLPGNARPSSAPSTWLRSVRRLSSCAGLSLLALLAILGMGIGFWFRAGVQPANSARPDQSKPQVPVNRDNQRKQDHLVVDLKAEIDKLPPSLSLFGPNLDSVIKVAPQGWRITLPAQRDNTDIVGVQLPRLRGDFAISLGYELLSVGEPWPRLGAGVWIRTWFDTPSFLSAMLSRNNSSYHKPHEQAFAAFKIVKGSDGQEKYLNSVVEKAHRSRGKLLLGSDRLSAPVSRGGGRAGLPSHSGGGDRHRGRSAKCGFSAPPCTLPPLWMFAGMSWTSGRIGSTPRVSRLPNRSAWIHSTRCRPSRS